MIIRHPVYGLAMPERGWVPAPRYLLRRQRILALVKDMERGRVLEVGCGAGALLSDLTSLGFDCNALEISDSAYDLATAVHADNDRIKVHRVEHESWNANFDYVLSFDVLEHIQDDRNAVLRWRSWLKPGGRLLLSVPAHPRLWNISDELAGHFRRYERKQLEMLLDTAGIDIEHFECYGFPLSNITERVRAVVYKMRAKKISHGIELEEFRAEATAKSGIERSLETKLYPVFACRLGTIIMQGFFGIQNLFLKTNLGSGFLVIGKPR